MAYHHKMVSVSALESCEFDYPKQGAGGGWLWPRLAPLLLTPCLEHWIVSGTSTLFCLLVLLALFLLYRRSDGQRKWKAQVSAYFWTTLSLTGLVAAVLCISTIWKLFPTGSISAHELIFSISQTVLWLLFALAVGLERNVVVETHNLVIRIVWILTFLVCVFNLSSSLLRLGLRERTESAANYLVLGVTFPGSVFLLIAALVGKTGVKLSGGEQNGHLSEPLLGNGVNEDGGEAHSKDPGYTKYASAGIFSTLGITWLNPVLKLGKQKVLGAEDIPHLGKTQDVEASYAKFKVQWDRAGPGDHSLPLILILAHRQDFAVTAILGLIKFCVMFAGPLLLQSFVDFTSEQDTRWYNGVGLVALLLLAKVLEVICNHQSDLVSSKIGIGIWAGLVSAIYQKGLKITSAARQTHGTGKIVNYLSVDAIEVTEVCQRLHELWQLPIQIILAMVILYIEVGVATIAGIGAMVFLMVFSLLIAMKQQGYFVKIMEAKDHRMKVTNEALSSMKIIKLYAWMEKFLAKVEAARSVERAVLTKVMYLIAINIFSLWLSPLIVSVITFGTCVLLGIPLTPAKVFTAIATFRIVQEPLRSFPQLIMQAAQALVSVRRIKTFLNSPELDDKSVTKAPRGAPYAVEVHNGDFKWEQDGETLALKGINVQVTEGSLTAIVGTVGSGKSCLLSCILGEMEKVHGEVVVSGTVAYVPQTSWIQNGTIKDNILFGKVYDDALYKETLRLCALVGDLEQMIHGDQTEIGERGINLSGGQKQRVQLARAIYQDADVYLLDDIFSALDAHTGSSIFKECVTKALSSKTVLMVTHQVEFLPSADLILVMQDGAVVQSGKYDELIGEGMEFGALVDAHNENLQAHEVDDEDDIVEDEIVELALEEDKLALPLGPLDILPTSTAPSLVALSKSPSFGSYTSTSPVGSYGRHFREEKLESQASGKFSDVGRSSKKALLRRKSSKTLQPSAPVATAIASNKLIEEEEREKGKVSAAVYWAYATKILFGTHVIALIFIQTFWQGLQIASDFWLADSTAESAQSFNPKRFIVVYSALAMGSGAFVLARSALVSFAALRTGQRFFLDMIRSVFRAPMSFFDTTPIGRVLTRSSTDQMDVDTTIPFLYGSLLANGFQTLGVLFIMSDVTALMLVLIVPLGYVFVWYQIYYISTSRELTRLESVTEAPIIQHFSETISGFATVRAFGHQERFMSINVKRVNCSMTIKFHNAATSEWLGIRLELIGCVLLCASALGLVLSPKDWIRPEFAGLCLSYGLALNSCLYSLVWIVSMIEQKMVAVERILQYTNIPSEAPLVIEDHRPAPNWPSRGSITVKNLRLRYRPDTPLVLKGVSFTVKGGEKLGVVGRTGSGKSSLIQALFRIVEPADGKIVVDGVDLSTIGLGDLRSRFSIIPQEPTLFEGTVRNNVDPLEEYTDAQIWEVLEKCRLADIVREKEQKLDFPVTENGDNWSMGQRQLFCLGRALLRRSRILVLDEATASVDSQTDNVLQKTIAKEYQDDTIISIAHRIPSVMDSDKVLVLDAGLVKEFGPPSYLLDQPSSMFSALVQEYWNRSDSLQDSAEG